jgi:glycosyltransferase involved in cell wall biosynthesis/tetratricopeptide (TPR) repeat protein
MATISLGMIVKNEARTLRACLESVAPFVDEIVIGLGGESTDSTAEIAAEFTDKIFPIEWKDDFSDARNQVLQRVTGEYFLWLDGDDILINGEKLRHEVITHPNVDSFFMGYDYARDDKGNCLCYLVRERVVKLFHEHPTKGWEWIGKVHEVLDFKGGEQVQLLLDGTLVQHHKPANKHEPDRNAKILYQQLAEQEPNPDPRILVYLANEASTRGNLAEAIMHWQRFVKLSGWDQEKYQAQHRIADAYRALGQFDKALRADLDAIEIMPEWPDAFLGLAETYLSKDNPKAAIALTEAGATKQVPQTMLIINPLDYSFHPSVVLAGAYARLGQFDLALANYQKALSIRHDDTIERTMILLQNEINLQNVTSAFLLLREHMARNDEWLKVRKLYDVVPKHIEQHPKIQETWQRTMQQTAHVLDPQIMVDFYTGNPHWTPMQDEQIVAPSWLDYPRMKFAIDAARRVQAKNVVDWGCSDGFIALPLARELGIHVTGFDLDPRCVDLATLRAEEWGLDARFEVGNVDQIGGWEGPKADLAIFFEVIEHMVDPAAALDRLEKTANHIALTTPYMSWEHGNIPAWDKLEPKGHLRIFDQYDIERLLTGRGRIWNLYRQPWGQTGWLFAEYDPGVSTDKTIMIGAMNTPEPWNPRQLEAEGRGGSETAIAKLTEGFAGQGHRPIVYSNINEPGYYNGVCYRDSSHFRPQVHSDVYVSWRTPEAADWEINTDCLVLWMHDTDAGDRLTVDRARKFDKIVVLTNWHKQFMRMKYPFIPEGKFLVIGNGVDPGRFAKQVDRNPKRVIYSSSPDRGLDVILEGIWPKVLEAVPDAELHVYYGWNNFDLFAPTHPHLAEFRARVERLLLDSKNVVQHGRVPQDRLAEELLKSGIWLYPTYFTETYCITAVEAQLAGLVPITNTTAALSEVVRTGRIIEGDVRDPKVQNEYVEAVVASLQNPPSDLVRSDIKNLAPALSWATIAALWAESLWEGE